MSYWDRILRAELSSEAQERDSLEILQRRRVVEEHRPLPPVWMRSLALEPGFVRVSPVLLAYAHALVHNAHGVRADKIPHVLSTVPWLERTALRTADDIKHEARRVALLLDGATRVFLAAIYEVEGNVAEAQVLRQLPPIHSVRSALIATKVVVGFLEAELQNVAQRPGNTQVLFVNSLRELARAFIGFDRLVKVVGGKRTLPPIVVLELVRSIVSVFCTSRRTQQQEVQDDFAIALIGMMAQIDSTVLADLPA